MPPPNEVEIKFCVRNLEHLEEQLELRGFHCITPSTHELNTLYDLPGHTLRRKGQLLRLRQYGGAWLLTHKARAAIGRHKSRIDLDRTPIGDIAEIEGTPQWIDRTAKALGVKPAEYITKSYTELFFDWKRRYKRKAVNMTFRECGGSAKAALNARKSSAEAATGSGVRPRRA